MRAFRVEEESKEVAADVLGVSIASYLHKGSWPFDTSRQLLKLV